MFERFTESARKTVFYARFEASRCGSPQIEAEHLLLGVLHEGAELIQRLLLSPATIEAIRARVYKQYPVRQSISTSVDMPMSAASKRVLAFAAEEAKHMNHEHIGPEHLLLGLEREKSSIVPDILRESKITRSQLRADALLAAVASKTPSPEPPPLAPPVGRDVIKAAQQGKLGRLVGRERELERVIHILSRRTKNNCVLIGEAGIGKTAIVEGLAMRIAEAQVPLTLAERHVIAVDASSLVDATRRPRWEQGLIHVLADVSDSANTLLFVRGLFNLAVAGSAWTFVEAMHALEPHLTSGGIQCIATGTPSGYRETVERAPMVARHFEVVEVLPVNEEEAIQIVSSLVPQFERFHEVTFAAGVIEKAVYASGRVLPGRHLPDRAIDLLDEAATAVRLRRGSEPLEIAVVRKKIRELLRDMENAIGNHEFEEARRFSDEERREREKLTQLRERHQLSDTSTSVVTPEDIEASAAARADVPLAAVQSLLRQKDVGELRRIMSELSAEVPLEAREWVPFLASYLTRCSAEEAERLARVIVAAKQS